MRHLIAEKELQAISGGDTPTNTDQQSTQPNTSAHPKPEAPKTHVNINASGTASFQTGSVGVSTEILPHVNFSANGSINSYGKTGGYIGVNFQTSF